MYLILIVVVVVFASIFELVQCGDIFTVSGRSYYSSYPQKDTAFDSYEFCVYNGMHLVEVMDQTEHQRVVTVIKAVNKKHNITTSSYWTAGTDMSSEGGWWWASNGYAAIYTNWADNQPENSYIPELSSTENCLVYANNPPTYLWDDASCVTEHYFLCRDSYDVPVYPTKSC